MSKPITIEQHVRNRLAHLHCTVIISGGKEPTVNYAGKSHTLKEFNELYNINSNKLFTNRDFQNRVENPNTKHV